MRRSALCVARGARSTPLRIRLQKIRKRIAEKQKSKGDRKQGLSLGGTWTFFLGVKHNSVMWKIEPNKRKYNPNSDWVSTVKKTSTPIRGILRDRLSKIPGWQELVSSVPDALTEVLRKKGVRGKALDHLVNEPSSFGAADTSTQKIKRPNRWVENLAVGTEEIARAWDMVQQHVEYQLLPDIISMLPEASRKSRYFDHMQLRPDNEYSCIRRAIMIDPVNSSVQTPHIDIANPQLQKEIGSWNIWNIFLPIQVEDEHPETAVLNGEVTMQDFNIQHDDVYFFDGMKKHFGRGNDHTKPRLMIQFVYVQTKLLQHPLGREEISQQYQPNGVYAAPEERNIFDPDTIVGDVVAHSLSRLGVQRSGWERDGGLSIFPHQKKKSWLEYAKSEETVGDDSADSDEETTFRNSRPVLRAVWPAHKRLCRIADCRMRSREAPRGAALLVLARECRAGR